MLGSVFDYDEKIQVYRNQLHDGNSDVPRPVLTQDERAMRVYTKAGVGQCFGIVSNRKRRSLCIGSRDVPNNTVFIDIIDAL